MTKTQALQRLYKALTNKDGRNTSTKVIEDLAVAAENGEIGGGGGDLDIFHVTITDEDGGGHNYYIPNIVTENGTSALVGFYMVASSEPETIDVVGYDGVAVGLVPLTGLEVTGDIQKNEASGIDTILMITGDGTISFSDSGGGGNAESI